VVGDDGAGLKQRGARVTEAWLDRSELQLSTYRIGEIARHASQQSVVSGPASPLQDPRTKAANGHGVSPGRCVGGPMFREAWFAATSVVSR
jgi:hypothetical protein